MRQAASAVSGFARSIRLVEVNSLALDHNGAASDLIEYRNDILAEKAEEEHLHAAEVEDREHDRRNALRGDVKVQKLQDKKRKGKKEAAQGYSQSGKECNPQGRAAETDDAIQPLIDELPKPVARYASLARLPCVGYPDRAKPGIERHHAHERLHIVEASHRLKDFPVHELKVADVGRIGHVRHAADELVIEVPGCAKQDRLLALGPDPEYNLVAGLPMLHKGRD